GQMKNLEMRAAVIGAGFAGIGMSVRLAQAGIEHLVFERADTLGGTWRGQPRPGLRLRRPHAAVLLQLRPQPGVVAPLRAAGGDPGLPRAGGRAAWRAGTNPLRPRGLLSR